MSIPAVGSPVRRLEDTSAGGTLREPVSGSKVELVVEGGRRQNLLRELRSAWDFREVVWAFAERDVRLKYKQAALGIRLSWSCASSSRYFLRPDLIW